MQGTRTTSINGAFVALKLAVDKLLKEGKLTESPIKDHLAAISVGINKDQEIIADLNYEEDSTCEADVNIVMTGKGQYVEVQGTAEGEPFSEDQLNGVLECAKTAISKIVEKQKEVLS